MYDEIQEALFLEEFRSLEPVGQFDLDGVPDCPRPGEADEGFGFGDDEIAEHREAGGDSAGGGVGEEGDVQPAGVVEPRECRRSLGHLHEA